MTITPEELKALASDLAAAMAPKEEPPPPPKEDPPPPPKEESAKDAVSKEDLAAAIRYTAGVARLPDVVRNKLDKLAADKGYSFAVEVLDMVSAVAVPRGVGAGPPKVDPVAPVTTFEEYAALRKKDKAAADALVTNGLAVNKLPHRR